MLPAVCSGQAREFEAEVQTKKEVCGLGWTLWVRHSLSIYGRFPLLPHKFLEDPSRGVAPRRAGCDFTVVSFPFPNVWTLIFPHCPEPLSLLRAAQGSTQPGGGEWGASVCFPSAVFPPSFCFTWEEIGEEIINTMCS